VICAGASDRALDIAKVAQTLLDNRAFLVGVAVGILTVGLETRSAIGAFARSRRNVRFQKFGFVQLSQNAAFDPGWRRQALAEQNRRREIGERRASDRPRIGERPAVREDKSVGTMAAAARGHLGSAEFTQREAPDRGTTGILETAAAEIAVALI